MENLKVKKVCGLSVSSMHFSMMILPYVQKELKPEKNIITILEKNLEKNIKQILSKINLNDETKQKILNIDWNTTDIKKNNVKEKINIKDNKDLDIIVYGSEEYINLANKKIEGYINEIKDEINNIKIINCYNVEDFKANIKEILDNHDIMFNTSGEHEKTEIFKEHFSA